MGHGGLEKLGGFNLNIRNLIWRFITFCCPHRADKTDKVRGIEKRQLHVFIVYKQIIMSPITGGSGYVQ